MKIKFSFLIVLFISINFSTPVYSGVGAIALYKSIIELIIQNIKVIKGKLAYLKSEAKALVNSEKVSSDTVVIAIGKIRKYSEKLKLNNAIGETGFHVTGVSGVRHNINSFAPSACIRSNNNNISYDLATNVFSEAQTMKSKLSGMISEDSKDSGGLERKALNVSEFIKKNKDIPLNPFALEANISKQQFQELADIISYIVSKNPASSLVRPNKGGNRADYHAKRIRYEEFINVVQSVFVNHIKFNLVGEKGESEKDLLFRIRVKANSLTIAESMVVKYKAGELKELNGTFSDIIMIDVLNQNIKRDNLALLSLLATASTDAMAKKL
ncbi:MAG: hypothetical protein QM504_03375 [Pseudomonadota bacterium]